MPSLVSDSSICSLYMELQRPLGTWQYAYSLCMELQRSLGERRYASTSSLVISWTRANPMMHFNRSALSSLYPRTHNQLGPQVEHSSPSLRIHKEPARC